MGRSTGPERGEHAAEVVCLGEALALLPALPEEGAPLPEVAMLAGAEANVAVGLARAGIAAAWVGRLGADELGGFLHAELERSGVDVGAVVIDPTRPTGCYAKVAEPGADGEPRSRMIYRRAGSAATAMDPAFLDAPPVRARLAAAHVVHTSGITAALSDSCAALMHELTERPRSAVLSFDVNWREQMWPAGDPGPVAALADGADIVLVGGDEAQRVFGTDDPAALRRRLPHPRWIVVKDGARRALAVARNGTVVDQPALQVEVVEPIGAGDAFAAGLLTGVVRGEPIARCLRRGHLSAAAVLTVPGDSAPLPPDAVLGPLLHASEADWTRIRVSATGFAAPVPSRGEP
jgi:2-dehydro-3-deoxygluconokinase